MANTPRRMARGALGTVSATLYTVPAATTAIVTEIIVTNTADIDAKATITLAGTALLDDAPIPANGLVTIGLKQVLSATEILAGFASATGCNVFVSGVEVT